MYREYAAAKYILVAAASHRIHMHRPLVKNSGGKINGGKLRSTAVEDTGGLQMPLESFAPFHVPRRVPAPLRSRGYAVNIRQRKFSHIIIFWQIVSIVVHR